MNASEKMLCTGLMAALTESREDFASMSTGHPGLGGFNVAMAARYDAQIERVYNLMYPPKPAAPAGTPIQGKSRQSRITDAGDGDCVW